MLSRLSDTYKWICTFNLKTLFLSTYILLRGLMRSCTGPRLIFFLSIFSLGPTFNYQLTLNLPTVIWLLRLSDLATLSVHKCVYNLLSPNIWRLFGMDFRSMSKHCTFQSYSKVSNHLASWCRRNWEYLKNEKLKNSFQSYLVIFNKIQFLQVVFKLCSLSITAVLSNNGKVVLLLKVGINIFSPPD